MCFQVIANMSAAYKQGKKKNGKRSEGSVPSITCKVTDPLLGTGDLPPPKVSHYLRFPVETVLTVEQDNSANSKNELEFPLLLSSV